MEEIEDIGKERTLEVKFLFIIQNLPRLEELKSYIMGVFWGFLDGLYEFFKFNLCYYNILKIKNILNININLSFSKKIVLQKI